MSDFEPSIELRLWMAKQTNLKEAAKWQEFGEKVERERIIHLLDKLFTKSVVPGYQTAIGDAIALIKVKTDE
jgi:hypothetical protein